MESLKLQDIHLPADASYWPLALGWWLLLILLLIVIWLTFKVRKCAKQKQSQTKIITKFDQLFERLNADPSNANIAEINTLLRQLAITYYPRTEIASLTGEEWLAFLDKSGSTQAFSQGTGRILIEAPYQLEAQGNSKIENLNLNEFIPLVRNWVRKVVKNNS